MPSGKAVTIINLGSSAPTLTGMILVLSICQSFGFFSGKLSHDWDMWCPQIWKYARMWVPHLLGKAIRWCWHWLKRLLSGSREGQYSVNHEQFLLPYFLQQLESKQLESKQLESKRLEVETKTFYYILCSAKRVCLMLDEFYEKNCALSILQLAGH